MALAIALQMQAHAPDAAPRAKGGDPLEERIEFLKSMRSQPSGGARQGWNIV
jgi:hypothetical protein